MLDTYFADLHIHIGRDIDGNPVKITGSKNLTLTNILKESSRNKGIDLVGVIDSHVPAVQKEMEHLIAEGKAYELPDGGIQYEQVTLLLGSEIEIYDKNCLGPIHVLCFLPTLGKMHLFSKWLTTKMKNISLSSQRYYGSGITLQKKVKEFDGIFIPAHIFTPFKSLYGKGVNRSLKEVLEPDLIDGVELGLSSDTYMAKQINELNRYTFLTNSDAHSLTKIAREYQEMKMDKPSFKEFYWALHEKEGRKITKNFGINPQLGKYHTTVCSECFTKISPGSNKCQRCGSSKIIKGVFDRIHELKKESNGSDHRNRPPYLYQVPLEYLPNLGKRTIEKLLLHFGTEMNIIHHVPFEDLLNVIPEKLAHYIIQMRKGELKIDAGGGGRYGRIQKSSRY